MMDDASKSLVSHKIRTAQEIAAAVGPRPREKKVIMCHGTFDIVHPGHVRHLLYAKSKGDVLVASLTADAHIAKANFRPFVPQELRAFNLAALEVVDFVVIDNDPTPIKNISIIKPDYFAKGYEYTRDGLHPRTAEEKTAIEAYGGEIIFTPGDIIYSSSHIIETEPPAIATEKLMAILAAEGLAMADLHKAIDQLEGIRVHVIGDTIIDSYTHCALIGGMTKTPTMSVRYDKRLDFVGGAGIVAKHLRSAGADVSFSTVLGNDALAEFALKDLAAAGVKCMPLIDRTRPTTHKNAIIAGGYNLLKIDTLDNRSISERIQHTLAQQISETPTDILVFSDFRHGIFNRDTIPRLTELDPRECVPGRRQPGGEPLGQHSGIQRLRSDHAERARGAVRARRSGFGGAAARPRTVSAGEMRHAAAQARRARPDDLPRRAQERRGCPRVLCHRQLRRARHRRRRLGRRAACLRLARLVRHQEQRHRLGARLARRGHRVRARGQRAGRPQGRGRQALSLRAIYQLSMSGGGKS